MMFSSDFIATPGDNIAADPTVSLRKWGSRKRNYSVLKPNPKTADRMGPESWFHLETEEKEKQYAKVPVNENGVYIDMAYFASKHAVFPVALSAVIKSNEAILKSELPDALSYIIDKMADVFLSILKKKKSENQSAVEDNGFPSTLESVFNCQMCKNIINDPITIGCGHSFCRICLLKSNDNMCCVCEVPVLHEYDKMKSNVLLLKCVDSCFTNNRAKNKLKEEGNAAMKREVYHTAIDKYSKALNYASDHILLSNRSYAYLRLKKYDEALNDANEVVSLRPDWPKGYYRRGAALLAQGCLDEAAVALCHCISLDPSIDVAKVDLKKCLSQLFGEKVDVVCLGTLAEQCAALFRSACSKLLSNLACVSFRELLTPMSSEYLSMLLTSGLSGCSLRKSGSSHSLKDSFLHPSGNFEAAANDSKGGDGSLINLKPAISVDDVRMESRKHCNNHANDQRLFRSLSKDDFECSLCLRLFYDPVTTKCGHSFCRQCLERCLDHAPMCPLCKEPLTEYFAGKQAFVTHAVQQIMRICWPQEYLLRKQAHDEEMDEIAKAGSDQRHEIPIFLCTLAYPSLPCPLHIFEPRYRLMVRRCMETGTRQFGITINFDNSDSSFIDVGTVLEIRHIEYLPDGRSILDTRGGKRFRVLERSMRDGYHTAKIEFIHDDPVSQEKASELNQMCEKIRVMVVKWFESLPEGVRNEIVRHYGNLPVHEANSVGSEQGPSWLWWLTAVLPVDRRIQVSLISSSNLENRLNVLQKVLTFCLAKNKKSI